MLDDDEENLVCSCGNPGLSGPCPYAEDIHGVYDNCSLNCCPECRYNCAMDI